MSVKVFFCWFLEREEDHLTSSLFNFNKHKHLDFGYWPIQWKEQRKNCSQKTQENRTEGGDISKIWSFLTTRIYYCTKDTFFSWSTDHYLFEVVHKLRLQVEGGGLSTFLSYKMSMEGSRWSKNAKNLSK